MDKSMSFTGLRRLLNRREKGEREQPVVASHCKGIRGGAARSLEEESGVWLTPVERVGTSMPRSYAMARWSYGRGELS